MWAGVDYTGSMSVERDVQMYILLVGPVGDESCIRAVAAGSRVDSFILTATSHPGYSSLTRGSGQYNPM